MNYGLVQNNEVVSTILPDVGFLPDGSAVSGFDKLDPETLKECGWFEIEDSEIPTFDRETQTFEESFVIGTDKITRVFTIVSLPPSESVPEVPSPQDRITAIEAELQSIKTSLGI